MATLSPSSNIKIPSAPLNLKEVNPQQDWKIYLLKDGSVQVRNLFKDHPRVVLTFERAKDLPPSKDLKGPAFTERVEIASSLALAIFEGIQEKEKNSFFAGERYILNFGKKKSLEYTKEGKVEEEEYQKAGGAFPPATRDNIEKIAERVGFNKTAVPKNSDDLKTLVRINNEFLALEWLSYALNHVQVSVQLKPEDLSTSGEE